jgi:hypothetical protein
MFRNKKTGRFVKRSYAKRYPQLVKQAFRKPVPLVPKKKRDVLASDRERVIRKVLERNLDKRFLRRFNRATVAREKTREAWVVEFRDGKGKYKNRSFRIWDDGLFESIGRANA